MASSVHHHRWRIDNRVSRRAFSMAEVFLVVVIISTLSAIAVPRLGNFLANQRLAAASRRIVSELTFAQRRAKTMGVVQRVNIVSTSGTLELVGLTNPDHPGQPYVVSVKDEPYKVTSIVPSFGGSASVVFDAYGVPNSAGTIAVAVGVYRRTITVDPDTGRATATATTVVP